METKVYKHYFETFAQVKYLILRKTLKAAFISRGPENLNHKLKFMGLIKKTLLYLNFVN